MKQFLLIATFLLFPSLALASDHNWRWSNYYEGIAGGNSSNQESVCKLAKARAYKLANDVNCRSDPYGNPYKNSIRIGTVELPCNCQCVDTVCICSSKLEIVCFSKE